ncbi:Gfo/Idh/MocA family protein [Asanoa iriomotensis]|uniref:1-carboxy-3-chloro-3,4-dihydroxycyclo hexa-1,5-diene dehydrogenase n=1 Tax=Asanoa iriomotensis TaxID=234613 RepID=A0ABQ4CEE0_9ACTN|nr:Gfo/Idh/MocA family oxidoreductase [Asanoa iriomotensis]GIF61141.1 1-carboxy-3-chloro-3,4-dihydroxycyclo hexa-1,5-diene dehydrogenase [Asanoa iriomotensis]
MTDLRIGMISWAHVHAEFRAKAIAEIPGARVVAIADDDAARGRAAAARHGVDTFVDDWRDLVARDDLDIVMVHSENSRHAEQVVAAAEAGKHVFCEKPIATTVADATAMAEAVRRNGVDGTAAFVSRFSKEADRAKKIVDSGVLGRVLLTRGFIGLAGIAEIGCPPDMTAWMSDPVLGGGGAWIDEGSHGIDLLRWLVGDITEVSAFTANRHKPDLDGEDIAVALLRYADGGLGEIGTVWSLSADIGMRNNLEIYGTDGTLVMRATDPFPRVEVYRSGDDPLYRGWTTPHIEPDAAEPHDYGSWPPHTHHYKREVASYIHRARAGLRPFGPTLDDGVACLRVIAAGYESAAKGGGPVEALITKR